MLELKDLTKTYRPKKGEPVQALKGITLSFDDTGLVFILGKSGSGKSTLLNLIGGLDFADGGEIVIDGKSTKAFKESDYDSYRNTYIGFVFQEYNLLDEFTVGENVSLALELQSQKSDKARLDEILKQVDLDGYAGRKINELSGGQKQRVAIARAIVKNPKIVMADEPTGALDSVTGRAIFDTLKKLSEDKLVIVVSHDRDFAEQYGDRIIELADGEVVADNTKAGKKAETDEKSKAADIEKDKDTEREITQAQDGQFIKSKLPYKRALKMGARSMRKKCFRLIVTMLLCALSFTLFGICDVAASFDRNYATQSAFLLGNSNSIAFNTSIKSWTGGFGRNDTLDASHADLDKIKALTGVEFQGVIGNESQGLPLWDSNLLSDASERVYYYSRWGGMLPADQSLFDAQGYKLYGRLPQSDDEIVITKYVFDQFAIAGIQLADGEHIAPRDIDDVQDFLDKNPIIDFTIDYTLNTAQSRIVGVVDTNADLNGAIKNMPIADDYMYSQTCRFYFANSYHCIAFVHEALYDYALSCKPKPDTTGFGRTVAVGYTGLSTHFNGVANDDALKRVDKVVWLDGGGERRELAANEIVIGIELAKYLWPAKDEQLEMRSNCGYDRTFFHDTMSFSSMSLYDFRNGGTSVIACFEEADSITEQELELYKQYCAQENYVFSSSDCWYWHNNSGGKFFSVNSQMSEDDWRYSYACYLTTNKATCQIGSGSDELTYYSVDGGMYFNVTGRKCGADIINENANRIFVENRLANDFNSAITNLPDDCKISYSGQTSDVRFDERAVIVGIYYPKDGYPNDFIVNNTIYDNSFNYEDETYLFLIAPVPTDKTKLLHIAEIQYDYSATRGFYSFNLEFTAVQSVTNPFDILTPYLRVIGIVVGIFSVLLLGNYIALSISAKKKEIGILRALGAKKSDIFAIFINECVIITSIVLIIALICLISVCAFFNSNITAYGVQLNAVRVGIRQIAVLLAIGIGTAAIASSVPLYKLSGKKPIDSIRD